MAEWRIAICDDEELILKQLEQMVHVVLAEQAISYHIQTFTSGKELLEATEPFHMVFLDIEMPEMDGIEVGRKLRVRNPDCKIMIATSMVERFREGFQIAAFRFITKPFQMNEIAEAIQAYANQQIGLEKIEVYKKRIPYVFPQKEIQYIVSYGSYVELQIQGERFRKECTMKQIEPILDKYGFFRIHKQYIVNLYWVEGYRDEKVWLANQQLPVSRRQRKAFEKAYMEFDLMYRS